MDKKSTIVFINNEPVFVDELPNIKYCFPDINDQEKSLPDNCKNNYYHILNLDKNLYNLRISHGFEDSSYIVSVIDKIMFSDSEESIVFDINNQPFMIYYPNKIVSIIIGKDNIFIKILDKFIDIIDQPLLGYNISRGYNVLRNIVDQKFNNIKNKMSVVYSTFFKDVYIKMKNHPPVYLYSVNDISSELSLTNDQISNIVKFIISENVEYINYKDNIYKYYDIDFDHGVIKLYKDTDELSEVEFCHLTNLIINDCEIIYKN